MKKPTERDVAATSPIVPGPRRAAKPEGSGVRLSNHKTRSGWFQARAAWPAREAPVHRLVGERARVRTTLAPAPGAAQWDSIGPTNIGGRMTCVVCHPTDPDRIWAGAAGGGVWSSHDAGRSWVASWHDQEVLNVGSLAIDPNNSDVLYCGTGEANLSSDSYPGVGVYKSVDAGVNWTLVAPTGPDVPGRIGVVAVDPFDSTHLLIGGVGHREVSRSDDIGGLCESRDGGGTWRRSTAITTGNYWCHAIIFHPRRPGVVHATFTARGAASGIYRSEDGGATWRHLLVGLPRPERMGRTSLAVCASDPDVLYALAEDEASTRADLVLGVFRSADGGDSWAEVGGEHFARERQMRYGNTIAVHPQDPDHVICGGIDLHLSTDGGATWRRVTRWKRKRGDPDYAHADHHGLLMPAGARGRVYDPNDGGMDVSDDGGRIWENRSRDLAVTMFYDADVAQSDGRVFGGGTQDNGTVITWAGRADEFEEWLGGDGGWLIFDPQDAVHFLASYNNLNIWRYRDGLVDVSPPVDEWERASVWMAFIDIDPSSPTTFVTGSQRVWITTDDGENWQAVSASLDGSGITAIEVASADSSRIYVGTENGGFFRSLDGGDSWSANLAGSLPGVTITRLAASPTDADVLYATMANFDVSHVFRSDDGGLSWHDVDRGRLPDVPHHAIAIASVAPDVVYVANDVGVFVSPDRGGNWQNLTRNLPNVMVFDLVVHQNDATLMAATYGRSLWRLQLP